MKRFLVVGDANVDLIVSGLDGLPVLGEERLCSGLNMLLGGSCAICASRLADLGVQVDFWGKIGRDALGDFVVGEMRRRGIDVQHFIQDPSERTGACVALSATGDRALLSFLGSIATLRLEDLPLDELSRFTHLHSGSIFIQTALQPDLGELYRRAKAAGLSTSLDCGWDPSNCWEVDLQGLLANVDVFLPNEVEALRLTGAPSAAEAAVKLSEYGKLVAVKRGADGALACIDGRLWQAPAFPIQTAETTGAGDCFNAGLIYALFVQNMAMPQALRYANACGALGASSPGGTSGSFTPSLVERFIEENSD